eukprot:Skav234598  [mRNA]  locus=scaffold5214:176103:189796:- [translate_table: standard]
MASLRTPLGELIEKAAKAGMDEHSSDLLVSLPKDLSRRFARLRSSILGASSAANSLVVRSPEPGMENDGDQHGTGVDGSIKELSGFISCCEALERTGAWSCLDTKTRQEVIAFSTSHAADIQKHVRIYCKEMQGDATTPSTAQKTQPGLLDDLLETKPQVARGYAGATSTTMVPPLLPPPPRSSCSVRGPA